jgi:hypothetical protein
MGKYQSGQMGQTVNLLAYAFGGSNPSLPTKNCGSSSVDRALAFQAEGRGFEPRLPLSSLKNCVGQVPEWPNGADCKSAGLRLRWFESILAHLKLRK